MILDRFLRPRWQHRNPRVRKQALQAMDPSDGQVEAIFRQVVRQDRDPDVRRFALRYLCDLRLLEEIGRTDGDSGVRQLATARLRELVAGVPEEGSLPAAERLSLLADIDDAEVLEYVVRNGREVQVRLAALTRIERDSILGDVAIHDPDLTVRMRALDSVTQKSTLERIVKATRTRDKRVSRRARESLKQRIAAASEVAEAARRRKEICAAFETMQDGGDCAQDQGRVKLLESEWNGLSGEHDAAMETRYQAAREAARLRIEQCRSREQALAPIRDAKRQLCETLEQSLHDLEGREEISSRESDSIESISKTTEAGYRESEMLPPAEELRFRERFDRAREALGARCCDLGAMHSYLEALRALCAEADAHAEGGANLSEAQLTALEERWRALRAPAEAETGARLAQRLATRLGDLRVLLRSQEEQRASDLVRLGELVETAERDLVGGQLRQAMGVVEEAQRVLARVGELSPRRTRSLQVRLRKAAARIRELDDWRRWGDTREKERLCEEMEALAGGVHEPQELAARVRAARVAWKRLGVAERGTEKAMWERFDRACTTAYEPCHAYFEQQAELRRASLEKREALCAHLEAFLAEANWEEMDWPAAERLVRDAERDWRTFGPVDRKRRAGVEKRFRRAQAQLEEHLLAERARNEKRKRALVERVEALAEVENLGQAVRQSKDLQAEWKGIGPSVRRKEQQLWKRFRAGCDAVFERRRQEREAKNQQRAVNADRKRELCEQIEVLATSADVDSDGLEDELRRLQGQWSELGPVPEAMAIELEERFSQACRELVVRVRSDGLKRQAQTRDRLRKKAALCAEIESLVEQIPDATQMAGHLDSAVQAWESIAPLEGDLESRIRERFDLARRLIEKGDPDSLSELVALRDVRRMAREDLCVRMELLAGVESPPEAERTRLEYQVARLSVTLSLGAQPAGGDVSRLAWELECDWELTGPAAAGEDSLEARFQEARDVLWARLSGGEGSGG
jgi:exonuclease SbcC